MNRVFFLGSFILASFWLGDSAVAQSTEVSKSERFELRCLGNATCDDPKSLSADGGRILAEMERIRDWLTELGFPEKNHLARNQGREILHTGETAARACGGHATACHRIRALSAYSELWLPIDILDGILADTGALVHEYVHAHQPDTSGGAANWLREAVATAIDKAWSGGSLYPPDYRLSLDLPFHFNDGDDLTEDAGYRNWAYLLHLGDHLQSTDSVAYLADPAFLNDRQYAASGASTEAMKPFHDAEVIGNASFDKVFPGFVARFNNLDSYGGEGGYYYYKTVQREGFPGRGAVEYQGSVNPYAAAALLLTLDEADASPDGLLLAQVEITESNSLDDLTLAVEHGLGQTQHGMTWLIDASDPPAELGFFRIVHAPKSLTMTEDEVAFTLQARASPVDEPSMACLQTGMPQAVDFGENDITRATNWRLISDNGTVEGLEITPARAGQISLALEVDSIITRQEGRFEPAQPRTTTIPLGTFPVSDNPCMIRFTLTGVGKDGALVQTFTFDGEYTEIAHRHDEAMYFSADRMMNYSDGEWIEFPPQVQAMMAPMIAELSQPYPLAPGEDEVATDGPAWGRGPHMASKRFAWASVRDMVGPDGKPLQRTRIACPTGGTGCTTTTFAGSGRMVTLVFDAQGRPLHLDFGTGAMTFEYGNWPIRRPPGW